MGSRARMGPFRPRRPRGNDGGGRRERSPGGIRRGGFGVLVILVTLIALPVLVVLVALVALVALVVLVVHVALVVLVVHVALVVLVSGGGSRAAVVSAPEEHHRGGGLRDATVRVEEVPEATHGGEGGDEAQAVAQALRRLEDARSRRRGRWTRRANGRGARWTPCRPGSLAPSEARRGVRTMGYSRT